MGNFSYLIQKKFRDLNSEQQKIFISEFERRKKSVGISYLLWFLLGWHYAYLKKWGWLILYILTAGGFFIWAIIDLFRIPKMVGDYNNNLALEIVKDIVLMFPEKEVERKDENEPKNDVNTYYFEQNRNSGESYSVFILVGIIILFGITAFFTKPERIDMQNKIVNEVMITQPKVGKLIMNLFVGEKLTEQYSNNFIKSVLSKNGYNNIEMYEEDYVVLRKLDFKDENSKESLVTAYGMFGLTKIYFNNKIDLSTDTILGRSKNKKNYNEGEATIQYQQKYYDNTSHKPSFDKSSSTIQDSESTSTKRSNDSYKNSEKTELKEDSIKI